MFRNQMLKEPEDGPPNLPAKSFEPQMSNTWSPFSMMMDMFRHFSQIERDMDNFINSNQGGFIQEGFIETSPPIQNDDDGVNNFNLGDEFFHGQSPGHGGDILNNFFNFHFNNGGVFGGRSDPFGGRDMDNFFDGHQQEIPHQKPPASEGGILSRFFNFNFSPSEFFSRRLPAIKDGPENMLKIPDSSEQQGVMPGGDKYEMSVYIGKNFSPDSVKVTQHNGVVTIEAKTGNTSEDGRSRSYQQIRKQFSLPGNVNINKIKTVLSPNGVLKIEAPKSQQQPSLPIDIPVHLMEEI